MESNSKCFDDVTQQVLKHYLSVIKKDMLNDDGIKIIVKKTPVEVSLFVTVDEESENSLADELRSIANKSPKSSHTQCTAAIDVVHRSNQDYRNAKAEMGVFGVKATVQFNPLEFEFYCKQLR